MQGITPDCVGLQRVRDNLCFDPLVNTSQVVYPQCGHGSIKLGVLFNNPNDPELSRHRPPRRALTFPRAPRHFIFEPP